MPYIEPESIGVRASTKKELDKYRCASEACWDDFLLAYIKLIEKEINNQPQSPTSL